MNHVKLRRLVCVGFGLIVAVGLTGLGDHVGAAPRPGGPDETVPDDSAPEEGNTDTVPATPGAGDPTVLAPAAGPLVVVPPGCLAPDPATAVFRGTVLGLDDPKRPMAARFAVSQMLAGDLVGWLSGGQTEVQFGDEAKFLTVGKRYIVGTKINLDTGQLVSTVRQPAPLFGGDAVIGVEDTDIDCPRVEDPVRTLNADATAIDTGVLSPLRGKKSALLGAVLKSVGGALALLVALVLMKDLVFAIARAMRDAASGSPPASGARPRRHRPSSAGGQPRA